MVKLRLNLIFLIGLGQLKTAAIHSFPAEEGFDIWVQPIVWFGVDFAVSIIEIWCVVFGLAEGTLEKSKRKKRMLN